MRCVTVWNVNRTVVGHHRRRGSVDASSEIIISIARVRCRREIVVVGSYRRRERKRRTE
jgi:hypothetical protein